MGSEQRRREAEAQVQSCQLPRPATAALALFRERREYWRLICILVPTGVGNYLPDGTKGWAEGAD